jgi:hypothetical protein
MHSTRGRGRDCQSLDSDVLANKESASTGSAISMPQGSWLIRMEFSVGPPPKPTEVRVDYPHRRCDRIGCVEAREYPKFNALLIFRSTKLADC